jgi:hypothetical protein
MGAIVWVSLDSKIKEVNEERVEGNGRQQE